MSSTPRHLMLLDLASVTGLALAVVIALWPARVVLPASALVVPPATPIGAARAGGDDSTEAAAVVSANILSGSRRAPTVRYASPDLAGASEVLAPSAPFAMDAPHDSSGSDSLSTPNADVVPSLYGVVHVDGAWHALLRLSERDAAANLFKEGDRRGAYRVVSIFADRVVVAGPAGQRTLRLARAASRDSTGVRP